MFLHNSARMSKGPKSALQEGDEFFIEGDPLQMMVGGMEGSPVRSSTAAAGRPPTQPKRDFSSDSLVSLEQQQQSHHHHHSMRPKTLSFGQGFQVRYYRIMTAEIIKVSPVLGNRLA